MKRLLLTLAVLTVTGAAGTANAQTAIAGGANVILPPGGANAARVMVTTAGPIQADTTIEAVVASAPYIPTGAYGTATAQAPAPAAAAQRRIEMDGYRNVRNVAWGSDGRWHATATRGSQQVAVTVNPNGNVAAQ